MPLMPDEGVAFEEVDGVEAADVASGTTVTEIVIQWMSEIQTLKSPDFRLKKTASIFQ